LPDGLLEVYFDTDPEPSPVLIEFATFPEQRAHDQALFDALGVLLARRKVPEVLTVVLHPKGKVQVTGNHQRQSPLGWTSVAVAWRVMIQMPQFFAARTNQGSKIDTPALVTW
jgi:hypothetical protein